MSNKSIGKNITIAIIPFILLIIICLFFLQITYHLKVFKTLIIFISNVVLLFIFSSRILGNKTGIEKEKKYLIYFILYFTFIFIQFLVSFFSGEASYDREYYLANYIFLIIFSLFTFLFIKDLTDINNGLILLCLFFLIIFCWSTIEYFIFKSRNSNAPFSSFRPDLSFGNVNYFAGCIIGLFPLAFITPFLFYKKIENKTLKILFVIILPIIIFISFIFPLFFTQTKAAQFGFYIGAVIFISSIIIMLFNKVKIKEPIKAILKILIFIFCITYFVILPILLFKYQQDLLKKISPRLIEASNNFEFILKDRINAWAGGIGLFKDHPIFGAGSGTIYPSSFKYINKYFYIYSDSNSFKHAHNEYVEVLGEAGIFGITLFFILFGSIIISLLKRVYSKKYNTDYKLICLSTVTGIISILILQIFCLSLRMSVTMSVYFFLLGLGVFLISYSKNALLPEHNNLKKNIKSKKNNFIEGYFNKIQSKILLLIITIFIIIAFILFLPLYKSERNIIYFLKAENYEDAANYLSKAIKAKPDNVYAWTHKYEFDNNTIRMAKSENEIEAILNEIRNDLDKLESIIPGYQENYSKMARYYTQRYQHYIYKYNETQDTEDFDEIKKAQKEAYNYFNKSLNMNFLRLEDHIYRLLFINILNDEERRIDAIKDYFSAKIYVDFCRANKIVKEKASINFWDNDSEIHLQNDIYNFFISLSDIEKINNDIKYFKEIKEFTDMEDLINRDVDNILTSLYEKQGI